LLDLPGLPVLPDWSGLRGLDGAAAVTTGGPSGATSVAAKTVPTGLASTSGGAASGCRTGGGVGIGAAASGAGSAGAGVSGAGAGVSGAGAGVSGAGGAAVSGAGAGVVVGAVGVGVADGVSGAGSGVAGADAEGWGVDAGVV
jgi:hypothetical protein